MCKYKFKVHISDFNKSRRAVSEGKKYQVSYLFINDFSILTFSKNFIKKYINLNKYKIWLCGDLKLSVNFTANFNSSTKYSITDSQSEIFSKKLFMEMQQIPRRTSVPKNYFIRVADLLIQLFCV